MRSSSFSTFGSNQKRLTNFGFGLVELLVCISIMALVTGVIITKNGAFNSAVLLRNQTYEVAFALREAQMLAVSGSRAAGDPLQARYGVYFVTSTANQQTYQLFHDLDNDSKWDSGEEVGSAWKLDARFKVRTITHAGGTANIVSVTFTRPNFDALFKNGGGTTLTGPLYIDVAQLAASNADTNCGLVRRVEVTNPGQIAITEYNNC